MSKISLPSSDQHTLWRTLIFENNGTLLQVLGPYDRRSTAQTQATTWTTHYGKKAVVQRADVKWEQG